MMVITRKLHFETRGNTDIIDISREVEKALKETDLNAGLVTVFVTHSTAGITAIECESGLLKDFKAMFERLMPRGMAYSHDSGTGEGNGFSHVRASLLGPSVSVPFSEGRLVLGTWQQIVLVDFDNRPRSRTVFVQVMGE